MKRGRKTLDRIAALKQFCEDLQKHDRFNLFIRDHLTEVAIKTKNPLGMKQFTFKKNGYGNYTRLSHGNYCIPDAWLNGKAPWDIQKALEDSSPTITMTV